MILNPQIWGVSNHPWEGMKGSKSLSRSHSLSCSPPIFPSCCLYPSFAPLPFFADKRSIVYLNVKPSSLNQLQQICLAWVRRINYLKTELLLKGTFSRQFFIVEGHFSPHNKKKKFYTHYSITTV